MRQAWSYRWPWPVAATAHVATAACLALPNPGAAQEGPGWSFYGQLNFGLMSVENGGSRESYFAENPHVPSRVGVLWQTPLQKDATLTFQVETGFGLTNLGEVSQENDRMEIDIDQTVLRRVEVIYDAATLGRISFGQGSMASDGASGVDLSRTGLALGPAIGDLGGGTAFLAADGTASGVTVADVFDDLDGPRRFRLRYDTPDWNGLRLAVAYGQEVLRSGNDLDYRDIALTYTRDTETLVFEAATSYEWIGAEEERALASASLLHKATGLNATLASGANRIGEGGYVYAKLGIIRDLFPAGPTAVALEYYDGEDFDFAGSQSRSVGLGLTQNIAALNLDLVASLRRYELSSQTETFQDIDVAMIGARWRF